MSHSDRVNNHAEKNRSFRLKLSFLTLSDQEMIHQGALDILDQTGIAITHAEARKTLLSAGCREHSDHPQSLLIPPKVVEQALADSPEKIDLYTRDGEPVITLGTQSHTFLAALHVVHLVDDETGARRPIGYEDACTYGKFMNQMDFLEVVGAWTISDRPPEIADRFSAHAVISNSHKPFYFAPLSMDGLKDVHQMCAAAAGSDNNLAEKPFWITSTTGIPPLSFPDFSIDRLLFAAEKGIPVVVAPVEMAGTSSPLHLGGTLSQIVASNLAAITVAQLCFPGAPLVMGGVGAPMDMRTGLMNYAGPEFNQLCSGLAEMGQYYRLPVWGTGGCSSAKQFDTQAASEMTASLIFAGLSGSHLIHDVAFLDNGLATSYQSLIFCNEVASFIRHMGKPLTALAPVELAAQINKAEKDGSHMTSPETLDGIHGLWDSSLMERRSYETWDQAGRPDLNTRLGKEVSRLLETSLPVTLQSDQQEKVDQILHRSRTVRQL